MSTTTEKTRFGGWDWVALALFIVGAVSRFWALGEKSLWYDEITGAFWASRRSIWEILGTLHTDSHPPLTAIFTQMFISISKTGLGTYLNGLFLIPNLYVREFWLRLYPAICATLTFPVVYLLVRRHIGKLAAIFTIIFLLLAPMNIFYSQDARPYASWLLFTCLSCYFFLVALAQNKLKHWIGFGLATLAALYTHYFAVLPLLAQCIFLLIFVLFPRYRLTESVVKSNKLLLPFSIIVGMDIILFIPFLVQGLSSGANFVPPNPPFILTLAAYYDLVCNLGLGYLHVLLFTLVLAGLGFGFLWREKNSFMAMFLLIMSIIPFLTAPLIIAYTTRFWSIRFAYVSQWAFLGLAGSGAALSIIHLVKKAPQVWKQVYAGVLILALSIVAFFWTWLPNRAYYAGEKQNIRGAAYFILSKFSAQDAIIAYQKNLGGLFSYYVRAVGIPLKSVQTSNEVIQGLVDSDRGFIFTNNDDIFLDLDKAGLPFISLEFEKIMVIVVDKRWRNTPHLERFAEINISDPRTETISIVEDELDANSPEDAIVLISDWCKLHPDDTPALAKYARCLIMLGDLKGAYEQVDQALVRDMGNAWLWVLRAEYLHEMDKTRAAIWSLRMGSFLAPENLNIRGLLNEWARPG